MNHTEAMREILAKRGYSIRQLADKVGVTNVSLGRTIRRENAPLSVIAKYLNALGYQVAFVPSGANLPDGSYLLEEGDER